MKLARLYIDTSVFGGCLDDEFCKDSNRLVNAAKKGKVIFVLSDAVFEELIRTPIEVQNILSTIPNEMIEILTATAMVAELRDAYLKAKILSNKSRNDAIHVAYATIARVDAIVSWNFRHIVRFDKIKSFNQVNFYSGYGILQIVSPKEVLFDE
ncbi:MAG: PIN domain-containing protein [Deltaproteobacteria bacterium]|nr:PIN domain-containing protein [Deltaproteobacteria bacterium]